MSKILEMRQKRAEIWEQAKAFLEAHQGDDGVMNTEDTEQYERMEQEVVDMGHAIERMERAEQMDLEMNSPANPAITDQPERPMPRQDDKRGTSSDAYKKAFWSQIRGRTSYEIRNALQVGEETEGGYTVPDEFERRLIQGLEDNNKIGRAHV